MTSRNSLHLVGILQTLSSVPNQHLIPIAQRVRRNRQRLFSSLLIENASERRPRLTDTLLPETFPIKASDNSETDPRAYLTGREPPMRTIEGPRKDARA